MSRPSEAVSSPLSPGTSTSEMTPRSLKKRPGKMALQEFGGVDPFPSVGTPLSEVNRPSTLNRTVDISSPRLQASDKDGSLSVSKASGSGLLRPQLTLELDKSTSGVDPMPSLEARRAPGADPVPWDDELFDPTADGDYMDFDEEDMARQSASSPIQEEQGEDDEDDGPEPGVDIAAVEQALQAL